MGSTNDFQDEPPKTPPPEHGRFKIGDYRYTELKRGESVKWIPPRDEPKKEDPKNARR